MQQEVKSYHQRVADILQGSVNIQYVADLAAKCAGVMDQIVAKVDAIVQLSATSEPTTNSLQIIQDLMLKARNAVDFAGNLVGG